MTYRRFSLLFILLFSYPCYLWGAITTEDNFYKGNIELYPTPVPALSVKREVVITRNKLSIAYREFTEAIEGTKNQAVLIRITAVELVQGSTLKITSIWKNIHPKQKINQKSLDKKPDRTMGAGGLFTGDAKASSKPNQQLEKDVAYKVPKWGDHLFLLANGIAYPLDISSADLNNGANPSEGLTLARYGQEKEVQLLFRIPSTTQDIALQFFDNVNGHIQIPLAGDIKLASSSEYPKGLIAQTKEEDLELGVIDVSSSKNLHSYQAADGWSYLTIGLIGKSKFRKGSGVNIARINTEKYVWLEGDGGFIYNLPSLESGSDTLSFTPLYFSLQRLSFLVPDQQSNFRLAIRNGSLISYLNLSAELPESPPTAFRSFKDGNVADWQIFSITSTKKGLVVDMGVRGLDLKKGLEIQPYKQIRLDVNKQQLKPDKNRSQALAFGAKNQMVVPPNGLARFLLAFNHIKGPANIHIKGLRAEGDLPIGEAPSSNSSLLTMVVPVIEESATTKTPVKLAKSKKTKEPITKNNIVTSKPIKEFTFPDWNIANAVQEKEMGDSIENATDLGKELVVIGNVGGKEDHFDYYYFDVQGKPKLWAIEAVGSSVKYLIYLDPSNPKRELIKTMGNPKAGETQLANLMLMPGRHWIKINGSTETGEYLLRARVTGEVETGNEREPNDDASHANRIMIGGSIEGLIEDGSYGDNFRFSLLAQEHLQIVLEESENLKGRLTFSGAVKIPDVRAKSAGESISYQGIFPPGDYLIQVRTSGPLTLLEPYRLTITRKNPFSESGEDQLTLPVEMSGIKKEEQIAAYWPKAQRISRVARIKNLADTPMHLALQTWTSNPAWHAQSSKRDISLTVGETKEVAINILIEPDAKAIEPVSIAVSAKDTQGRMQTHNFEVAAVCGSEPVKPERFFPPPSELLGGLNVAWQGLGAELSPESLQLRKSTKELIDGMTPVNAGLDLPGFQKLKPVELTVKLAGLSPIKVAGVALNPLGGCSSDNWARNFEIELSSDGKNYQRALSGSLERLPREQYFVLDNPVLATHARLRILSNHGEKANRLCLGEWKVIASPEVKLAAKGLNIASPKLGGHIVWRSFKASDFLLNQMLEGNSRRVSAYMFSDLPNEWVVGFQHNRMAHISSLEWEQEKQSSATTLTLSKVRLAISQDGATGPWETLGVWNISEKDVVSSFPMKTPVWARFIRFTTEVAKSHSVTLPQQIRIFEQESDSSYRSVVGEWGHYSELGPFEWQTSSLSSLKTTGTAENFSKQKALPVEYEKTYQGAASLGSQSSWYSLVIPPGSNHLEWVLEGYPVLSVRPLLTTMNGTMIPIRSKKLSGRSSHYQADVEAGNQYLIKVEEPPRSVVFAWDNSGSVAEYSHRIYQAMTSFVEQIQPGREFVNLLPFQNKDPVMLLEQWSDQPLTALKALHEYSKNDGSSDAELNLKKAVEELEDQDGNRVVIIITDGESGKTVGDGKLWEPLNRVYPRIFSFEMHSSGRPAIQDKMQDWAKVNSGHYSFFSNQTDLDVGFDRAVCMLRRPARFDLVANTAFKKPAGPGNIQVMTSQSSTGTAIEIILDASGSMYKKLGSTTRIATAKSVLKELMQTSLPQGIPLALRIYGHRKAKACDTKLELPLRPFKPEDGIRIIAQVDPKDRSKTPLAESLLLVAEDLKSAVGTKLVILLTDGEESCGGNPEEAIRTLREQMEIRVNIVGLAIDSTKTRNQFSHWAKLGGGLYFETNDSDGLKSALVQALFPKYQLINNNGEIVAESVADGTLLQVPEGNYQLKVLTTPTRDMGMVRIKEGATVKVEVKD